MNISNEISFIDSPELERMHFWDKLFQGIDGELIWKLSDFTFFPFHFSIAFDVDVVQNERNENETTELVLVATVEATEETQNRIIDFGNSFIRNQSI